MSNNDLQITSSGHASLFEFSYLSPEAIENWVNSTLMLMQKAHAEKKAVYLLWDFREVGDAFQLSSHFKQSGIKLIESYLDLPGKIAIVLPELQDSAIFVRRIMEIFTRTNRSKRFVKVFVDGQAAQDWIEEVI